MKIKCRATMILEWEENSENWKDDEHHPFATEEDFLCAVKQTIEDSPSYVLESDSIQIVKVELVP